MNIAEWCISRKTVTFSLTLVALVAGVISYNRLGRLEDPEFTIKQAVVTTLYPGATAQEVEEEVSDVIEQAAQQLGQLDDVTSMSQPGMSIVTVSIQDKYDKSTLPQVWNELRHKINDIQHRLPPGAGPSIVNDDFGDVYGVFFAVTGDGYSYAEIKNYVDMLKRELLLCKDVKRIQLFGEQQEVIYIQISRERISQLGIPLDQIFHALSAKNLVADAGNIKVGEWWIMVHPSGEFTNVQQFGDLLVSAPGSERLIYLRDVAEISRGYRDPAETKLRFDGRPAIGIAISTVEGGNVVTMGRAIEQRLLELESERPVGIKLGVIAYQSRTVTEAVNGFIVNLIQAIIIVIAILLFFMGMRCGLLIGFILLLTICASFIVMDYYALMLQRISLGALIIALGMLVDNAIVVTEGILVGIQRGMDRVKVARDIVAQQKMPLLGATVIAVTAFAAIGLSQDSSGEYCGSLFWVLLITLMLSWVTALTVTPLLAVMFLKGNNESQQEQEKDPYDHIFFRLYRCGLLFCLRWRWGVVLSLIGLLVLSGIGFRQLDQSFFPNSTRPQFMIDLYLASGTHITETEVWVQRAEEYVQQLDHVQHVSAFIGSGAPRFLLTYASENSNSAYAQLLVEVDDYRVIDDMLQEVQAYFNREFTPVLVATKKFVLGPGSGGKIQVRFRGPDHTILRQLAQQTMDIMHADGQVLGIHTDWRQMALTSRPQMSEIQASRAGITRNDVAQRIKAAFEGQSVGVYREGDTLIPIVANAPADERDDIYNLNDLSIYSPAANQMIPLRQVVSGFESVFDHAIIQRKNRMPTITVHCDPIQAVASTAFNRLRPQIEAIELPPEHSLEWGGEYESSSDARGALAGKIPLFAVMIVLILIGLFNNLRHPLIICLCVPLALIGVTFGLLVTNQPFGFMALLGLLSLSGMLIKNAIVLIDQINAELHDGKVPFFAVMDASVSRLRPVSMAAATTILGMLPLISDAFFISMAVTIMFGLAFATVLTLVVVPVLYVIFFRVPAQEPSATPE